MKSLFSAFAAAVVCCLSCVEINYDLGSNMVADSDRLCAHVDTVHIKDISYQKSDSLSGYSLRRVAIGAIRDDDFGLSTRGAAFALIPMYDTLDFGIDPVVQRFHLGLRADSISVSRLSDAHILQDVYVYELSRPIDPLADYDCNAKIPHEDKLITRGVPVINGTDSLSFDFSKEYAQKILDLSSDKPYVTKDMDDYLKKIPGIYLETSTPTGNGGRYNFFEYQLGFDIDQMMLTGNLARLSINTRYSGREERVDTSFFFYFGADRFYDLDSLLSSASRGNYPQYCLNVTASEEKVLQYKGTDKLFVEGGGGVKPVVDARALRARARERILKAMAEANPPIDASRINEVVINKATLVFPFEYPGDDHIMYLFPDILSPTLRSYVTKTKTLSSGETKTYKIRAYASITDSSSSTEDSGDINRNPLFHSDSSVPEGTAMMSYNPDITYYMQSLMAVKENDTDLLSGAYDIWMMIQAYESITTTSATSSSGMSDYYQYLAYQSYYNSMYNSSYSDYYSNYYSYMLAAQYAASGSNTTTSVQVMLDKDRYYNAVLRGRRDGGDNACVPYLKLIFSIPKA